MKYAESIDSGLFTQSKLDGGIQLAGTEPRLSSTKGRGLRTKESASCTQP